MAAFLVIGLNALGRNLARELHRRGHKLQLADISQDRINRMQYEIPDVVRLDTTEREVLKELNIPRFDHVIVCMGHRFEVAERTTLALKDLGARKITNVATTKVREDILRTIGADDVVTPGIELSRNLAVALHDKRIDRFTFINKFSGVAEILVPISLTLPAGWRSFLGDDCVVASLRCQSDDTEDARLIISDKESVVLEAGDQILAFGDPEVICQRLNRVF